MLKTKPQQKTYILRCGFVAKFNTMRGFNFGALFLISDLLGISYLFFWKNNVATPDNKKDTANLQVLSD
jgi:hypothetical protein